MSGVSWYEAAAYAEFVGKSLPTLHHWYRAADLSRFSEILQYSNFGGAGPRPVGQQPSLTSYGNYDMAGNVREWVWNATADRRYTLGGGWSDPTYLYTGPDALDPMDRSPILGLRCALYETPPPEAAFAEIQNVVLDRSKERPVDDRVFAIYRRLFDYDPIDLATKVEAVDDRSPYWRAEKVSFAAAYGGERIIAWLFLPKNAAPPYQTLVYFPPSSAESFPSIDAVGSREFAFLVRSGRAVLFPVYQQTYERRRKVPQGPNYDRELLTERTQDVRRALDYLETRPDVDRTRLAFYGLSMGAYMRPGRRRRGGAAPHPRPRGGGPRGRAASRGGSAQFRAARARSRADDQRPVRFRGALRDEPAASLPPPGIAGEGQEARGLRQRPRGALARRSARDPGLAGPLPGAGSQSGVSETLNDG